MTKPIWLIGVGIMSLDYAKVLKGLNVEYLAIGRGEKSAKDFEEKTGHPVIKGGLETFLYTQPEIPDYAIISVGVEQLKNVTIAAIRYGVERILVEKPAGLNAADIKEVRDAAKEKKAKVFVAYNRRFYASVLKAKEIIAEDGGVTSFNFEFTEWSHTIEPLQKATGVKENWFLGNSSHVVDMAFFMGGKPSKITCYTGGGLSWHPAASIFAGAGIARNGALFSYQANWAAPGRWGVEILTKKHRLIFRPLEKLQIQNIGSVAVEFVPLEDRLDTEYKPGLYKQVELFLKGKTREFCTIDEQFKKMKIYNKMANY